MDRRIVNPWTWQDRLGFVQANDVAGSSRVVLCSGQASVSAGGKPVHPGDMRAQGTQALDNLEVLLGAAGLALADVVRLVYYTTDMAAFRDAEEVWLKRLAEAGCRPATTLLGVASLAIPDLLIEMEATAMA